MSGLCGWIAPEGQWRPEALAAMTARLPVPQGKMCSAVVGKAALAAPDGQLVLDGNLLVGYTGIIRWRDSALEAMARQRGDGLALMEAWRRYGPGLVDHVSGQFSLAVLEGDSGRGIVATDRAASHPIAYAEAGQRAAFATSVQSLRLLDGVAGEIPLQSILTYLVFYVMPAPQSIYAGISKLSPREYLSFSTSGVGVKAYAKPVYASHTEESVEALSDMLREGLRAAVDRSMDGLEGEDVGAFLSGGLDSSSVTAYLAKRSDKPVKTFTIGFDEPGFDESEYARIVADAFKTEHHELYVTPKDVAELIPRLADMYDEPFGNSSAVPAYYCARAAREAGVTTMLAGDGGDELFAGNERYISVLKYKWYEHLPRALRKGLIEPVSRLPGFGHLPMGKKVRGLVRYANTPLPDRLYAFDFFAKEPIDRVFDADKLELIDRESVFDLVRASYEAPETGSEIQRMMYMDASITLADNDLRKVNRMTALAGVDVRYPMLDDALMDFAASLPDETLLYNGKLRGFYKKAMTGVLPSAVLTKSKHGFGLPFSQWLKSDPALKEMADDALRKFKKRHILKQSFVDSVLQARQQAEDTILDRFAWDIMILELWMQRWEDGA